MYTLTERMNRSRRQPPLPARSGLVIGWSGMRGIVTLAAALARAFTPASGLAYLVFVLLYTPCIATVGAIQAEHGRRVAWVTVAYQMATAWVAALLVYQIARHLL